ncbi:cation transporter [Leucobacter rhizosphaerae]|uniref:Cation transporter n=1 Tax=Leucobacter rhizosphaerae TaxID=2932245 RepID=A0ABY4FX58_9MICO|nr:cation transporter [Leucobacter rhizosphaerae]UOQ60850.1 cation transporter [Leucobacter rhizosphaerae]
MTTASMRQHSHEQLPEKQREARRSAIRWQIFTIAYTSVTIIVVAFVLGNSQAMKTAWIEDMLSLVPQIVFLLSLLFVQRRPTKKHPYGWHRVMGVGHLIAGVALLAVGLILAVEAGSGLLAAEHPTIGTIVLFGHTVWLGWIMVAVMAVIVAGPLIYGPAKAKLAPVLHNKLLYADGDMAKADWHTNAASIVGVLGIGAGLWWLDGVAALFISVGIVVDGFRNTSIALQDLMDQRARSANGKDPHSLVNEVLEFLAGVPWVADAALRMRDQGQVFHVEVFVEPQQSEVSLEQLADLSAAIARIDWKLNDVVVVATQELPEHADRLS